MNWGETSWPWQCQLAEGYHVTTYKKPTVHIISYVSAKAKVRQNQARSSRTKRLHTSVSFRHWFGNPWTVVVALLVPRWHYLPSRLSLYPLPEKQIKQIFWGKTTTSLVTIWAWDQKLYFADALGYHTAGKHSSAFTSSNIAASRGYSAVTFSSTASLTAMFSVCKW